LGGHGWGIPRSHAACQATCIQQLHFEEGGFDAHNSTARQLQQQQHPGCMTDSQHDSMHVLIQQSVLSQLAGVVWTVQQLPTTANSMQQCPE